MLLRRVIGDALRARRQDQRRTLREISTAANVSLGYLSEIERGQKEASSELLASVCEALGSQLSEVLREASDSLARVERTGVAAASAPARDSLADGALSGGDLSDRALPDRALAGGAVPDRALPGAMLANPRRAGADEPRRQAAAERPVATGGTVSVSVRRNGPLRTTLHAVRADRADRVVRAGSRG